MTDALLVVAKRPAPGRTKTRLCPPLDLKQAASLYECFLQDTLDIMRSVPLVQNYIVYLPEEAVGYFQTLAPDMILFSQRGETLGERLDHLLTHALHNGADKAVVVNSDSPSLPPAYLHQAFIALDGSDVVLGPAEDGGYYLIGMKSPHPELLLGVEMSTPRVLADTLDLADRHELRVSILPGWYDVDTQEALLRLREEVLNLTNSTCTHTIRWFQQETTKGSLILS